MDALTYSVFREAKRCVLASGSEEATIDHLLAGWILMARTSAPARRLLDEHRLTGHHTELAELAERALGISAEEAERRRFPLELRLRDLVAKVYRTNPDLDFAVLAEVIAGSGDPSVEACRAPEGVPPISAAIAASRVLESKLKAKVFGQDAAVRMLARSYAHASLRRPSGGPRGVFTFLGPPGVGKTLLAETFAAALENGQEKWPFRRFDMSAFVAEQSYEQLFGVASFYRGASVPGTLTGFAKQNPRCVLLFDEIEKAHPAVVLSLLAVLDKGEIEDKFLSETVSFRDAWIILTTNLGHEFFEQEHASGILSHGRLSTAAVFDILLHSRGRRSGEPALAPEFVSRLAKGGAILFERLSSRDLLRIVDSGLSPRDAESSLPAVRASDTAKLGFLLSLMPNVDARQAAARSEAWRIELAERAVEECPASAEVADAAIEVRCSEAVERFLSSGENAPTVRVLVVDDDEYLAGALERGLPNASVRRAFDEESVVANLGRTGADIILLDLSIGEERASNAIDRGTRLLALAREKAPSAPVVLFSENPDLRTNFEPVASRAVAMGGARGFLPCRRSSDEDIAVEDFVAGVARVVSDVRADLVFRRFARTRKQVTFETALFSDSTGGIVAELRNLREATVLRADDASATIRFAGVPTERFADLVGLDRVKSRLSDVVTWLREPQRLAAFGVSPPRGILLAGPPGTGKTSIARAFAGEAGLPFLALSASELRSMYVGDSEAKLRELYARARRYAPAIVFLDEIDSIGRARDGGDRSTSILNELLTALDGFDRRASFVFTLAATNLPESLDPALLRPGRFDETIVLEVPSPAGRRAFFESSLSRVRTVPGLDVDALVRGTSGCTPADLDRIVREAAYRASKLDKTMIDPEDLELARRTVRYGAVKNVVERPNAEDLALTAAHEAGHALVHLLGKEGARLEHVSIRPVDGALGFVMRASDEGRRTISRADLQHAIAVSLAGREAELLHTGDMNRVTTGAADDFRKATRLAVRAVTESGLDDELGPICVAGLPEGMRDAAAEASVIRVRAWLLDGRERARALLERHREAWTRLSRELLQSEELSGDRVDAIVRSTAG